MGMEDLHEMLVNAAISGASVHICHALATGRYGGRSMWADMLSMVEGINQQGVDVSLEQYPYPCESATSPLATPSINQGQGCSSGYIRDITLTHIRGHHINPHRPLPLADAFSVAAAVQLKSNCAALQMV